MKKLLFTVVLFALFSVQFSASTTNTVYDENGEIKYVDTIDDNEQLEMRENYSGGIVMSIYYYENGKFTKKTFLSANGDIRSQEYYTNGLLSSIYKYTTKGRTVTKYDTSKYITAYNEYDIANRNTLSCTYVNKSNTRNTCQKRIYKAGRLYQYTKTIKGKTTTNNYYDSNGKAIQKNTYKNGKIAYTYKYNNSKLVNRFNYTNGFVKTKYSYDSAGRMTNINYYKNYTRYGSTGKSNLVTSTVKYHYQKNNIKTGKTTRTYKNGKNVKTEAITYITYYNQYQNPKLACPSENINSWGCFMTSFAMQYSAYSNKTLTPAMMWKEGVRCFSNLQTYGRSKGLRTTKVTRLSSKNYYNATFKNTGKVVPNGRSTFKLSEAIVNYGMPVQLWMRANYHIATGFPGHSIVAYRVVTTPTSTIIYAHDPGFTGKNINLASYMSGGYRSSDASYYIIDSGYVGGVK